MSGSLINVKQSSHKAEMQSDSVSKVMDWGLHRDNSSFATKSLYKLGKVTLPLYVSAYSTVKLGD